MSLMNIVNDMPTRVAYTGNVSIMKNLIDNKPEVLNEPDNEGRSALHVAAALGNFDILNEIIQYCDPFLLDKNGNSPLSYACFYGNMDCVILLLQADNEFKFLTEYPSPLDLTCYTGHRDLLDIFIHIPQVIEHVKKLKNVVTPMHYAAAGGDVSIIEKLITIGADINSKDSLGITPIQYSCMFGKVKAEKYLRKVQHADIDTIAENGWDITHFCAKGNLYKRFKKYNLEFTPGMLSPIHVAASYGSLESLKSLLQISGKKKVENLPDNHRRTPLHYAAANGDIYSMLELVNLVDTIDPRDENENTPLQLSFLNCQHSAAVLLIRKGARTDTINSFGNTIVHSAACSGDTACLSLSLSFGLSTEESNNENKTPLHLAAENGHWRLVHSLLLDMADMNAVTNKGYTPLMIAAAKNRCAVVKILLSFNADPCELGSHGKNALHIAGEHGSIASFNVMLEWLNKKNSTLKEREKINTNPLSNEGKNILQYAAMRDHAEFVKQTIVKGYNPYEGQKGKSSAEILMAKNLISNEELVDLEKKRVLFLKKLQSEYANKKVEDQIARAIQLFNNKPGKGVEFLQNNGILGTEPKDIAIFLSTTENLEKSKIGEFIGKNSSMNKSVLYAFANLFDFKKVDFDVSLRKFLVSFRLPGEAQIIDRIMQAFSERYYEQNKDSNIFKSYDAVFVLAFSTIMLNTDAHNPQIKNKMTKAQFIKNNEGLNDGEDLDKDFLEHLYDKIVQEQIKIDQGIFENPERQGWLSKLGIKKQWQRKWFVCATNLLYYFESPSDKEPQGLIPLENVTISTRSDKKPFCIEIRAPETESGIGVIKAAKLKNGKMVEDIQSQFYVCAEGESELDEWLISLSSAVHHNPFLQLLQQRKEAKKREMDLKRNTSNHDIKIPEKYRKSSRRKKHSRS